MLIHACMRHCQQHPPRLPLGGHSSTSRGSAPRRAPGTLTTASRTGTHRACASEAMAALMSDALTCAPRRARGMAREPAGRQDAVGACAFQCMAAVPQLACTGAWGHAHMHVHMFARAACHPSRTPSARTHKQSMQSPPTPPTSAAASVSKGHTLHAAGLVQPLQHLLHGLCVALANVQLHLVDVIGLAWGLVGWLKRQAGFRRVGRHLEGKARHGRVQEAGGAQ